MMCDLGTSAASANCNTSATATVGAGPGRIAGVPGCPQGTSCGCGGCSGCGGGPKQGAVAVLDDCPDAPPGCDTARLGRVVGRGQGGLKQASFMFIILSIFINNTPLTHALLHSTWY